TMMMTIALTISRDVHQLRPIAFIGKSTEQSIGEGFAVVKKSLECDCPGNWAVVEKQIDFSSGWQTHKVCACWIDPIATHIFPRASSDLSYAARLPGCKN